MTVFSETIVGGYPEILTETHGLIQGAFVAGFLVGAVAQTKETNEAFKRNTQLTVYVDKKMATVILKPHLFLFHKLNRSLFYSDHTSITSICKRLKEA